MNSSFSLKVLTASCVFAASISVAFADTQDTTQVTMQAAPPAAPHKDEAKTMQCPIAPALTDGFYVGFQGGYDSYQVRDNVSLPLIATTGNPLVDGPGWVGGLFVGYGRYIGHYFYLGGEFFADDSGMNANFLQTSNVGYYKFNMIARGSYGISLLPGIKLGDTALAYLRLGYNWVNLRAQEIVSDNQTLSFATNKSHRSQGISYGLGLETLVYPDWALRAEYTHTNYSSFSSAFGTAFRPSDNQFMLGILYHFM